MERFSLENLSKKQLTLIGSGLLLLLIAVITIFTISYHSDNYTKDQIQITNLSSVTRGRQSDEYTVNLIRSQLYKTIAMNTPNDFDPTTVTDTEIRQDSFSQKDDTELHQVNFIVDIPSLRQSYRVQYQWAKNASDLDEYGTFVACPLSTQLIYSAFDCKDMFTETFGTNDPLLLNLPKSTKDYQLYSIEHNTTEKQKITAVILIHSYETRFSEKDKKVEQVKAEIIGFIKSTGADPENYEIDYRVEYGD